MQRCGNRPPSPRSRLDLIPSAAMRMGILGFPKTGKTTVFNALTGAEVAVDKFAGRSTKVNVGVAKVRDDRLAVLADMFHPKKVTPATVDYVDVPGLERGKGSLTAYLQDFKGVDALLHVVRGFADADLPHAFPTIDPARDIEAMEQELLLSDMALVETRRERIDSDLKKKGKDTELEAERELLESFSGLLEQEKPLRSREWDEEGLARVRGLSLLTLKPVLHVVNLGEDAAGVADPLDGMGLERVASTPRTKATHLLGKIEHEISRLSEADARAFLADYGLKEPTADRVAALSYELLDLISFLTAGEPEVRAWTIRRGTNARRAAGKIHSDIERGFIRAEVVAFDDLVAAGSMAGARDKGKLRLEGKDYVVKDGDVILFRFNV
jgi:hypothetical protein